MKFKYVATKPNGERVESETEADDLSQVLKLLTSKDWKPITVKKISKKKKTISFKGGRINIKDQIFIFRYLSLMLKIGTNLLQAVNILIEDFDKASVRNFLMEIRSSLEKGSSFYVTFAKYPKVFSAVNINLIKAGEISGNLEMVFENITKSLIKEKELGDQIRNALIYPAILLGISAFILVFLTTFALPKIANVFIESGFTPPLFSQIVFTVGLFFGKIWFLVFLFIGLVMGGLIYLYRNSFAFRKFIWLILADIPLIKDIIKKKALQRFASTTSYLVRAGISIDKALEISADAVGHVGIKNALNRIAKEGLAKGLSLGEAFKREPVFPSTVANLVAIAERAGHVESVLETLGDFYIKEVDNSLKRMMSFFEPLLLLLMGLVIGVIAISIIVPIYQLTTQF